MARIDDILKAESLKFRQRPVEQPTPEPTPAEEPGVLGVAGIGLRSLARAPAGIAANIITAVQGPGGVEAPGAGDVFEEFARGVRQTERAAQAEVAQQFPESEAAQLASRVGQQLAFSIPSTAAGVATGVLAAPAAALPVPGAQAAPFLAGGAAAGTVAFRTAQSDIMSTFIETLDEEKRAEEGRGLTPEEVESARVKFSDRATEFGLWEALPEAAGGALAGRLIFGPLAKVAGERVARSIFGKLGAVAAVASEELATETITQIGQEQTLAGTRLGVPEGEAPSFTDPEDIVEAFKQIAPDTLLLTAIMGGGLKGGQLITQRRAQVRLARELGINREDLRARAQQLALAKAQNPDLEITTEQMNQFLAGAVTVTEAGEIVPTEVPVERPPEEAAVPAEPPVERPPAAEGIPTEEIPLTEAPVPQAAALAELSREELIAEFNEAQEEAKSGEPEAVARFEAAQAEVKLQSDAERAAQLQERADAVEGREDREGIQVQPEGVAEVRPAPESGISDRLGDQARREEAAQEDVTLVQDLSAGIATEGGIDVPEGSYTTTTAPEGTADIFHALGQALGKRIVFFEASENAPVALNGATNIRPDTIFINKATVKPHMQVLGHEFLHNIKINTPEIYAEILPAIRQALPKGAIEGKLQALNAKRAAEGRPALEASAIEEEVIGDFFGEQFDTKQFWKKVARQNPTTFERIAEAFISFAERLADTLTGSQLANVRSAQAKAAEALLQHVSRNPQAEVSPVIREEAAKFDEATDKKIAVLRALDTIRTEVQRGPEQAVPEIIPEAPAPRIAEVGEAALAEPAFQAHPLFDHGELGDTARTLGALASSALDAGFTIEEVKQDVAAEINSRSKADPNLIPEVRAITARMKLEQIALDYPAWVEANKEFAGGISFDEPTQSFDKISGQRKQNMRDLATALSAGTIRPTMLPSALKVTPLSIVVEAFTKKIPQLPAFASAMRSLDATANDLADVAGIQSQEILKSIEKKFGASKFGTGKGFRRGVEKFEQTAFLGSFYQMNPHLDIMEQDWVPAEGTRSERLEAAQTAWEAARLQEATGKTFKQAYGESASSFNGLGEGVQEEYLKAVDQMQGTRQREFDNMKKKVEQSTESGSPLRQRFVSALETEFNSLKGAYWPIFRHGDYWLSYLDHDGVQNFELFDQPIERAAAQEALKRMGINPDTMVTGAKAEAPPILGAAPQQLFDQLRNAAVDSEIASLPAGATAEERQAAQQRARDTVESMTQIWLQWQPETSALKNSIRRKSVRGGSREMIRGYLKYMQTHGLRIAQMEEGGKLDDLLKEMDSGIREGRDLGQDTTEEQQVVNDLRARVGANKTSRTGWLARQLGRMSTIYMMTSPSIALVQMSQLGVLTMPKLSVMFGPTVAAKELTKGIQRAFSPKFRRQELFADIEVNEVFDNINRTVTSEDLAEGRFTDKTLGDPVFEEEELQKQIDALTDDQRRKLALRDALGRGVMDISLSHEVGEWVRGGDPTSLSNEVFSHMMFFMRESETASRKATILSTFEAANGHKEFFKAMNAAEEVTNDTLFDYSASSKGVALRGDTAKVLLTFQHFRIMSAFRIGLLFKRSIAAESAEVKSAARKEFIGIMSMSGLLSGALGMPFVPLLLDVLSAALSDEDEPVDAEAELLAWTRETFGEDIGTAAVRGPATLVNLSVAQRIGLGDVFGSRVEPSPTIHGRALAGYLATQMLGPAYAVTEGWFKGYDEIVNKGEVQKGLEFALPKPFRDVLRAYGLASEGLKTGRGKQLITAGDVSTNSIVLLALGFQPEQIADVRQEEFRLGQISGVISERRGRLMRQYTRGFRDGDVSGAIEDIVQFNKKNPRFAVRGSDLTGALRTSLRGEAGISSRREQLIRQQFGR